MLARRWLVCVSEFGKEGRGDGRGRGANPLRAELAGGQPVQKLSWKWFRCWFFCSPPPCVPPSPQPHSHRKPVTMAAQLCVSLRYFGSVRPTSGSPSPPTPTSMTQVAVLQDETQGGWRESSSLWMDSGLLHNCRHTFFFFFFSGCTRLWTFFWKLIIVPWIEASESIVKQHTDNDAYR